MAQHIETGSRPGPTGAPADEARLVQRVAQGDERAFDALFRRYRPRLLRYLAVHLRRPELVDEIVNDTMLVVWRRARAFDVGARVSTWIIGIALRTGLKAVARARRHAVAQLSVRTAGDDSLAGCKRTPDRAACVPDRAACDPMPDPACDDTPEHAASRGERERRLRAAIASLTPEHRAVLELAYFRGLSCREAASVLGCRVDTVKTRMFHARRRLRALLPDLREDAA
jgi:RNA polymerase sigma-70 factor (ECF subfamily)